MTQPINTDHPRLYESLTLVITEFEKAALKSETRAGMLVTAHSPLTGMEMILEGSKKTLQKVASSRESKADVPAALKGADSPFSATPFGVEVTPGGETDPNSEAPRIPQLPKVGLQGGVNMDLDFLGLADQSEGGKLLKKAIGDCLGCDMRVQFDWQLKPLNLLGPLQDMLDQINGSLDSFEQMIDPLQAVEGLCRAMNDFSFICIPDWVNMLMALKMLMRKYLSVSLKFKLDWTVVLGPLLKLIIDGVQAILEGIVGLLTAPLDCSISALEGMEELANAAKGIADDAQAAAEMFNSNTTNQAVGRMQDQNVADTLVNDVTWQQEQDTDQAGTPAIGQMRVGQRRSKAPKRNESAFSFGAGVDLTAQGGLDQLMKDPSFRSQPFSFQMTESIKESKQYVSKLSEKINRAAASVNQLIGGGLTLQLGNIGAVLFVRDMLAMVTVIIQLLSKHQNVKDWCEWFDENPDVLQNLLAPVVGGGTLEIATVEPGRLQMTSGSFSRVVSTCISGQSAQQQHVLSKWIADLNRES